MQSRGGGRAGCLPPQTSSSIDFFSSQVHHPGLKNLMLEEVWVVVVLVRAVVYMKRCPLSVWRILVGRCPLEVVQEPVEAEPKALALLLVFVFLFLRLETLGPFKVTDRGRRRAIGGPVGGKAGGRAWERNE